MGKADLTTFLDTFLAVIRAPETDFFILCGVIVLAVYMISLLGSIFNRVSANFVEVNAVFKAIFGDEGMEDLQEAEQALDRIKSVVRTIKATQVKVKEQAAESVKH